MSSYLLSIDQGTTRFRAILFDRELRPVAISQQELAQSLPADGWVDPESIWESVQFISTQRSAYLCHRGQHLRGWCNRAVAQG